MSRDTGAHKRFTTAILPVDLTEHSYTILDTSEGSVFLHVNHAPFDTNAPTGHVYISDWSAAGVEALSHRIASRLGLEPSSLCPCRTTTALRTASAILRRSKVLKESISLTLSTRRVRPRRFLAVCWRLLTSRAEEDRTEGAVADGIDQSGGSGGVNRGAGGNANKRLKAKTVITFDKVRRLASAS